MTGLIFFFVAVVVSAMAGALIWMRISSAAEVMARPAQLRAAAPSLAMRWVEPSDALLANLEGSEFGGRFGPGYWALRGDGPAGLETWVIEARIGRPASRKQASQTAVMFRSASARWPTFVLQPGTLDLEPRGMAKLPLGHREFDYMFDLRAGTPDATRSAFAAPVIQFMLGHEYDGFVVESSPYRMMVYRWEWSPPIAELARVLDLARQVEAFFAPR